jgi:integrase
MSAMSHIRAEDLPALLYALGEVHPKYCMLGVMGYKTGLRVGDVLRLRVSDISPTLIVTQQKTKKPITVSICPDMIAFIASYVKKCGLQPHHALIPSTARSPEKPLSRQQAFSVIRAVASKRGLESIGTHSLRKTRARSVYERSGSIFAVSEALGHDSPDTTLHYLVSRDKLHALLSQPDT